MEDILRGINVAPSILSADFSRLGDDVEAVLNAGARVVHIDVMDGHFVPNITIGPLVVKALQPLVHGAGALLDVHLMIEHPEQYVGAFAAAGADMIVVHQEACVHLHRVLAQIREAGPLAGVALNPATPIETLSEARYSCDMVLIMSVEPRVRRSGLHPDLHRQDRPRPRLPARERHHRGRRRRDGAQRRRARRGRRELAGRRLERLRRPGYRGALLGSGAGRRRRRIILSVRLITASGRGESPHRR